MDAYEEHLRKRFVWERPEGGASNDLQALRAAWSGVGKHLGFVSQELGPVLGESLPLLTHTCARPDAPRLLIATGFHGEEAAGPWGLLQFAAQLDASLLDAVNLALLPLVNATGFREGSRHNALNQNPNRGYDRGARGTPTSAEGEVLLRHEDLLLALGRDGVLACHEDLTRDRAYVYSFEPGARPGRFSRMLVELARGHFEIHPDGEVDGHPVEDGVVFNRHDGSFESWLVGAGVPIAACLETPGSKPFERRVALQAAWMRAFVSFIALR